MNQHKFNRYGIAHGYIVTANDNGTIPLNSRICAKLDGKETAVSAKGLIDQANALPDMVAALEVICNYMAHDDGEYCIQSDDMQQARAALAKVK